MFAHRIGPIKGPRRRVLIPLLVLALLAPATAVVAGCGGESTDTTLTITGSDTSEAPGTDGDATADADDEDLKVIEGWSDALNSGDVEGAAEYFAIPSSTENGFEIEIKSGKDAIAFNDSLPCGAKVIAAQTDGDITTATFELSDRPGGDCGSGIGGEAATAFKIEDGKIVEWRRVAVPGGGGEAPGDGGPVPGSPA